MDKKELKHFEEIILKKKSELMKELGHLEKNVLFASQKDQAGDLSGYSFHMADQASDSNEQEQNFMFASREGRFLHHLDMALERVKKGTYGKCQVCNLPIAKARLEAVPHARYCIKCKAKEEQQEQQQQATQSPADTDSQE
jgi:RNA polymerase-binding protein DksA